jgi:hypothetical protein
MRFVLCYLFLISYAFARTTAVNPNSFQIHVRPQLVGINQDMQQIFQALPGYPPRLFHWLSLIDDLHAQVLRAAKTCPRVIDLSCKDQLQATLLVLRDIEREWLTSEAERAKGDIAINALAAGRRWLQLYQATQSLRAILEAELISLDAGRNSEQRLPHGQWYKRVSEIRDWMDLLVIDYVTPKLQDDFRSAWMNFFRPIHKEAIHENNRHFLASNIDSLNFYWNLFNQKLTKRLKKTPEGMSGPLNAIQNRWNQVMRVHFGQ